MNMTNNLAQIRKSIKDTIIAILKDAQSTDLSVIKNVHYGESQMNIGNMPAIWIMPRPYAPREMSASSSEHRFTYEFVAMVYNGDPTKGTELVEDIQAKVYDLFIANRTLRDVVFDASCTRIDPTYHIPVQNNQVYFASVQFEFIARKFD